MSLKKLGITDKILFILGLTLCGVIAFVLAAGVIVALIALFLDGRRSVVTVSSVPLPDEDPEGTARLRGGGAAEHGEAVRDGCGGPE